MKFSNIVPILPLAVKPSKVPPEYRALHQYLDRRYADTVVLSFSQIEALLEGPLPELALLQEWWAAVTADGSHSVQSPAWTEAHRSASLNLTARNVRFERLAER